MRVEFYLPGIFIEGSKFVRDLTPQKSIDYAGKSTWADRGRQTALIVIAGSMTEREVEPPPQEIVEHVDMDRAVVAGNVSLDLIAHESTAVLLAAYSDDFDDDGGDGGECATAVTVAKADAVGLEVVAPDSDAAVVDEAVDSRKVDGHDVKTRTQSAKEQAKRHPVKEREVMRVAYRRSDFSKKLLQGVGASPQPAMSRIEAAARMSAVKDLLRSEIDQLSQAVEKLDLMQDGKMDVASRQLLASRRGVPPPYSLEVSFLQTPSPNGSSSPAKGRWFAHSSLQGRTRAISASPGSLHKTAMRATCGSDKRGNEWQREMTRYEQDLRRSAAIYGVQHMNGRSHGSPVRSHTPSSTPSCAATRQAHVRPGEPFVCCLSDYLRI